MSKKVVVVSLLLWAGCGARSPLVIEGALPASVSPDVRTRGRPVRPPRAFQPRGIGGGGALFGPTWHAGRTYRLIRIGRRPPPTRAGDG